MTRKALTIHQLDAMKRDGEKIASYKKPQYVEFVQEMPVLKDGLPDRRRIKELYGGPQ